MNEEKLKHLLVDLVGIADEITGSGRNVVRAYVSQVGGGVDAADQLVCLEISREAMVSLGIRLIELGIHKTEHAAVLAELSPVSRSLVSENLGVFLHPKSCKVVVMQADFGLVESLV